jgi:ER membrane protein complex subunit 6
MSSSTEDAAQQLVYAPNVVQTQASLNSVKFLSACFAGAAAGILGLTNWLGFALFLASTVLTSVCLYFINCKGKPTKYISGGLSKLVNSGQDNIFSFVSTVSFKSLKLVLIPALF